MLGQLLLGGRGRGRAERGELYGMAVLRVRSEPEGWLARRNLRQAGYALRRGGVVRALVPEGFENWALLEGCGLHPVNPLPFLQAQGAQLALGALERRGVAPDRAVVALQGPRAGRELARAAVELCPRVRNLVIDAPRGGRELAAWLRREFGMPVLPPGEGAPVELCFGPAEKAGRGQGEVRLALYGAEPDLAGLSLSAPALAREDRGRLPLLAALWEGGRLTADGIKIT